MSSKDGAAWTRENSKTKKNRPGVQAALDSLFSCMIRFNGMILSNRNCASGAWIGKFFGYGSPLCQHYLEERYRQGMLSRAEMPDSGSFSRHLADVSPDSEFETVLNLLYDVRFRYSDMAGLDKEVHWDSVRCRWTADGAAPKPMPMSSADVNQKIKIALSKLLRDYGNEPGGPELERNVVYVLGYPMMGFNSAIPPTWILHGAITINGGEIGISWTKPWSLPKLPPWMQKLLSPRYAFAFAADSVVLADAQPSAQGLTMPYRGPNYALAGLEWDVFYKPWMQLRLGARFGRKFPGGGENRIQFDPTLVLLERLRIGLCVETRLFDNERIGAIESRSLLPSLNIGWELLSW